MERLEGSSSVGSQYSCHRMDEVRFTLFRVGSTKVTSPPPPACSHAEETLFQPQGRNRCDQQEKGVARKDS